MRKPLLYLLIAASGVLLAVLHHKFKPPIDERALKQVTAGMTNSNQWQGRIAPDFTLKTLHGEQFQLSESIGKKIIVLNFFATWCGPCRAEMPELNRYYNEHKNESFLLVGIDAEETPERVNQFVSELKLDFPVVIDPGELQKRYAVTAFPTTVLIGVDGKVQFYESGGLANGDVAFDNYVDFNRRMLGSGRAISPEEYRRLAEAQPSLPAREPEKPKETKLDARGTRIATRMVCPCGCDDKVEVCKCQTAQQIRKALATEDFKNQSDEEIIRALNKRFCSGAM